MILLVLVCPFSPYLTVTERSPSLVRFFQVFHILLSQSNLNRACTLQTANQLHELIIL